MHTHRLALHAPLVAAGSALRDQTRLKMRYVIWIGQGGTHDTTHWSRVLARAARALLYPVRKSNREFIIYKSDPKKYPAETRRSLSPLEALSRPAM